MLLQCPRCLFIMTWERSDQSDGPGQCLCKASAPWRVLKKMPDPGHVIVYSDKGWQKLHSPFFKEDANAWKQGPIKNE